MDAADFLTRVVAPGAYYCFAYKHPDATGLRHKFFQQKDIKAAVDWLRHTANTCDVWHAVASFKTNQSRKQSNAEALQCFWYDADITRPGDGKAPETVWQTNIELIQWLWSVRDRLPVPNLWMSSGYGMHLYWVLDTPIPAAEWTEQAKAFRLLLKEVGARGDIGISADSSRVLRPPETFNRKVPDTPAPCWEMTAGQRKLNLPKFYKTEDILSNLTLRVSQSSLGPPPRQVSTKSLAAAKANLSKPPAADFATVADHCLQVKQSLAEEGEHDRYPLWHLLTNLTYFCDNREAAHAIGRKGVNYSEEDTDAKYDKTHHEHQTKQNFGAPSCESIDLARPGVCDNCQYRGKIKGPYTLGWAELPVGYRQDTYQLYNSDGDGGWAPLVKGTFSNPQVFFIGDEIGYQFAFDYTFANRVSHVRVDEGKIQGTPDKVRTLFVPKGVPLASHNAKRFGDFVVAWIIKLREALMVQDAPPSFGWVHNKGGGYLGMSVASTLYRVDGTEALTQPGDKKIHGSYLPTGDIKLWRQSCEYVIGNRPELHTLVGASFAAPLMELIGESGILSIWSQLSGARKTSAFRVATAVWCNPIVGMSAIKDTTNSVQQSLGETKIMPVFWDEIHTASKEQAAIMVEMFFNITQGRGRARLDQRMEQRNIGYWRTLLILSSNKPNAEMIEQDRSHTNAGALRMFEYEIEPAGQADQEAVSIVQLAEHNYGQAGRVYAKWITLNLDTVQSVIKTIRAMLYKDVGDIKPEERFHVATIVGIVAGAWIANKIGLVTLDWQGIYAFLKSKLRDIRDERQDDNPSDENQLLLMKFEKFITDNIDDLLITQSFAKPGRPSAIKKQLVDNQLKPVRDPSFKCSKVSIHIGLDEKEMRFDNNAFKIWCQRNGQSHTALLSMMAKQWPLRKVQAILAINTRWSSISKVWYYRLMLTAPELKHHLDWGAPAPATSNVVPFPPAAE